MQAISKICILVILPLLFIVGCFEQHEIIVKSHSGVQVSWASKCEEPVPGLDYAALEYFDFQLKKRTQIRVLLWTDINMRLGFRGMDRARNRYSNSKTAQFIQSGSVDSGYEENEYIISYKISIERDATGTFETQNNIFDLSNGTIFLFRKNGDQTIVKQIKRDMSSFPREKYELKNIAKSDKEILEFFSSEIKDSKK